MAIEICSYIACSWLLEKQPKAWSTIVILDSNFQETDFVKIHSKNCLVLKFDDIESEQFGKLAPGIQDVRLALEFGMAATNLAVCCRAGQSRSAAISLIVNFARIGPRALSLLNPRRHAPNSRLVKFGAEILGDDGLNVAFDAWLRTNKGIRISDYIDEIALEVDELMGLGAKNRVSKKVNN